MDRSIFVNVWAVIHLCSNRRGCTAHDCSQLTWIFQCWIRRNKSNIPVTVDLTLFTLLRIRINGNNSYTGRQHTCITSYHSNICNSQRNLDTFEPCFLELEAISGRQNSAKAFLWSSTYLLIPLLKFFTTSKTSSKTMGGGTSWFSSKIKRSRFWRWKWRLLLWYILIQSDCIDPTQLLKL